MSNKPKRSDQDDEPAAPRVLQERNLVAHANALFGPDGWRLATLYVSGGKGRTSMIGVVNEKADASNTHG